MKYRRVKRTEAPGDARHTSDSESRRGDSLPHTAEGEKRPIYQRTWFQLAVGLAVGVLVALLRQR